MTTIDDLIPVLKKLRLSGVLHTLDLRMNQAAEDNLSHAEFLYRTLLDEIERRASKQLHLRLRRANFEETKTIEDFDFRFNPHIPKAKLLDLANCQFISRRENIMLVGSTGVGKSHLAQAFGHRACMAGYTVLYVSARKMLNELRASRADHSYERRLLRFTTPDLLIVDDIGLRPLRNDGPIDLYEVITQRYLRGSMILTSNRAVQEWYPLFIDPLLASSAMDRLLHNAHVIEIEGESYRGRGKKREAQQSGSALAETG